MRFDTLLGDGLCDALAVTTLELTRKQVAQPAFEQWRDAAHEEQPDSPSWSPESATRALADWSGVETVIDQVLQIFAHSDLSHQLVLVAIHSRQLPNVSEDVLQSVGKLESVHVVQPILDVGVNDELSQAKNLTTQVESWNRNWKSIRYVKQSSSRDLVSF